MLQFLLVAVAFHIIPNMIMKFIKSTNFGHKLLGSTFSAGIELGRTNRVFNKAHKQLMKYGIGPESLVEYELGMKIGLTLGKMGAEEQEVFLISLKEELVSNYNSMTNEEKSRAHKTPFINTLLSYAKGEVNSKFEEMIIANSQEKQASSLKGTILNLVLVSILAVVEYHIVIQPIISFVRGKIAASTYGKTFLKNSFMTGLNGGEINKINSFAIDFMMSPSTLDAKRLGYSIYKSNKNSSLLSSVMEVM